MSRNGEWATFGNWPPSLVRSGEFPAMKIGGRGVWRVDRRQLEAYIERVHEETRKWAQDHPLGKDKGEDEP